MKITFKYILTLGILVLSFSALKAQSMSNEQMRLFKLDALRLIEDYETNSTLEDYEAVENFTSLFESDSVMIYNDLLGFSASPTISVRDYANTFLSKGKTPKMIVKNVTGGDVYSDANNWLIDVSFAKELDYTDACGTLLSSSDYYGADHQLKAVVAMDKESGRTFIKSLTGDIKSNRAPLPVNYAVVRTSGNRMDNDVLCNGQRLVFNKFNQALVPSNPVLTYYDEDVNLKITREPGKCEAYTLSFKPVHWRVKLRGEMSIGDFYKASNAPSNLKLTSSGTDFGLDVGYIFPGKGRMKLGVFLGAAYSMSKLDMDLGDINYNYDAPADADKDQDTYKRYYQLSDVKQSIKVNSLMVPVYVDVDFRLGRKYSIYVQAGVKGYLKMSAKADPLQGSAYAYGVYPKYGDLLLDESWDSQQFGTRSFGNSAQDDSDIEFKSFSLDGFAGLGFRFNVFGPLILDIGANYQMGLIDCFSGPGTATTAHSGSTTESQALMYYKVASGEHTRNLVNSLDKVKRQALNINVGLMIKF